MRTQFAQLCAVGAPQRLASLHSRRALSDWDRLCGDKDVVRVAVGKDVVVVGTRRLIMFGPKGPRWVGAFVYSINPGTKEIVAHNMSDVLHHDPSGSGAVEAHHPHLVNHHTPCFGDDNTVHVSKLFADGRLADLSLFFISFLKLYGADSHAANPSLWEEATKEEVVQWTKGQ